MKKYKVYCLKDCQTHEMKYIGQTERSLEQRFKDGYMNFSTDGLYIELIQDFDEPELMNKLELELIYQHDMCNKGYNRLNKNNNSLKTFKNGFSGKTHSNDYKKALGERNKVFKPALGSKSRTGLKNGDFQKDAARKARSEPILCLNNNVVYENGKEAAKALNLNTSNISQVVNGKRNHTRGFRFIKIEKTKHTG